MRSAVVIISIGILISFYLGCKKDDSQLPWFSYEKAAGIWVPYQAESENGDVQDGPFTHSSIFGPYDESVKINVDKSFVPVVWVDNTNFQLRPEHGGIIVYSIVKRTLVFNGIVTREFELIKFDGLELWLKITGITYKLKKEL